MEIANVTKKGQVVVPKVIRDHLGIQEGDKLVFLEMDSGCALIYKLDEEKVTRNIMLVDRHPQYSVEGAEEDKNKGGLLPGKGPIPRQEA